MPDTRPQIGFRDPEFPIFETLDAGVQVTTNRGQDSGLKASREVGCGKITLGITGLHEILGRDYGIEERYLGLS